MMKKILIYICTLLLFTATTTVAQNNHPEARRSAAEQAAYEKTIPVNPPKSASASQADSRMNPAETQAGPVNWKPGDDAEEERKSPEANQTGTNQNQTPNVSTAHIAQPEGAQPQENSINYRNMIGSKTQPEAPKSGNETNYRNIKGTPTQPACEKPQK